jgi:hypothetical protein
VRIIFFNIFYIFNNINLIYVKKIESYFLITVPILFLAIFYISNAKSDERYYETKLNIDKINLLKKNNNCNKLNYLLSEYEIWIMKNIYNKECRFYYDFKNEKIFFIKL